MTLKSGNARDICHGEAVMQRTQTTDSKPESGTGNIYLESTKQIFTVISGLQISASLVPKQ